MKFSLEVALGVAARSTPYVIAAMAATLHPALAAPTGGIAEVSTGATYIQTTFLGAGALIATLGIGSGAIHLAHHKEDWAGGAGRIGAGVAGATIIGKAPTLATMFAPVNF
ncbi:MAG: TrbC/VirB2 family protein [Candidatus Baltobacteraceae bacterium]